VADSFLTLGPRFRQAVNGLKNRSVADSLVILSERAGPRCAPVSFEQIVLIAGMIRVDATRETIIRGASVVSGVPDIAMSDCYRLARGRQCVICNFDDARSQELKSAESIGRIAMELIDHARVIASFSRKIALGS
jgi:hypothetical protein